MTIGSAPDQLTQAQLESTLRAAANALRGPVDPGDFKAYPPVVVAHSDSEIAPDRFKIPAHEGHIATLRIPVPELTLFHPASIATPVASEGADGARWRLETPPGGHWFAYAASCHDDPDELPAVQE